MATVELVEYEDASAEVRAIYDDIRAVRGVDFIVRGVSQICTRRENP